jgi:hypothetical protein
MEQLLTNIQQSFNQTNTTTNKETLLQKQQISQEKINELLEQSSQAIMCGPDCQKKKVSEELRQKYLDAETNIQTAPIKLEQSKKNYYIYTEGDSYYSNMKEEELKKKADVISKLLTENFNNQVSNTNTMNTYLNTALINSTNTEELLEDYLEKNKILKIKLREGNGDILTNDRKTYYENEALNRLILWNYILWYIYVFLFIILSIFLLFSPIIYLPLMVVFACYPYIINDIIKWFYRKYIWITSKIVKNVYIDI